MSTSWISVYSTCHNSQTAEEAWDSLKKAYEDKGLCRRLHLLMKLFSIKLNKIGSMQEYVSQMMALSQQLSDTVRPLDDKFIAAIMLAHLTP
jgi:hypothetical protein